MLTEAPPSAPATARWWRRLLGRPSDWHLHKPRLRVGRPRLAWLGPLAVVVSTLVGWYAFQGAQGEEGGSVAFGLFIGAASIVLMAWSFVLTIRIRFLERFFGGLDSMYRVHRWAGSLAVVAMFWHTSAEPEIEGGIRGASESLADQAEGLAETGELMLYGLVAISLLRWFPYRWWRWTHKLLGIPFAFACWHFYTAEKTYANGSPWGIYFGSIMVIGLVTFLWRVIGRDAVAQGLKYEVERAESDGTTLELTLQPKKTALDYHAGQFAILKIQEPGLREPHAFTIASSPQSGKLNFFIRDLGDWTAKLQTADLVGSEVIVEGPYGEFEPYGDDADGPTVWVAGGVGITPFLSAIDGLEPAPAGHRPTLFYCVRHAEDATAIDILRVADAEGRIDLVVVASSEGPRFSEATLREHFGDDGLRGAHIAACGPSALVDTAMTTGDKMGAASLESEDFDIRGGFGPDMSKELAVRPAASLTEFNERLRRSQNSKV